MHSLLIRPATVSDTEAIAPLFDAYRQFYEQAPDAALASAFVRARLEKEESVILLALDAASKPVGFCQLYPSFCSVQAQPIYVLYDLYVAPQARRTGAGTALLRSAEERSRSDGKARMDLTTARTNSGAQSVYESLGWVRDDVFFAYSKAVAPCTMAP